MSLAVTYLVCGFLYWVIDCILMSLSEDGGYDATPLTYIFTLLLLLLVWPVFLVINTVKLAGIIPKVIQRARVDIALKKMDKEE